MIMFYCFFASLVETYVFVSSVCYICICFQFLILIAIIFPTLKLTDKFPSILLQTGFSHSICSLIVFVSQIFQTICIIPLCVFSCFNMILFVKSSIIIPFANAMQRAVSNTMVQYNCFSKC